MSAKLMLHSGGHAATLEEVQGVPLPSRTSTWVPVRHSEVLERSVLALRKAGYEVQNQSLGLSHEGLRFFGVLDMMNTLAQGVMLAVGIRNSLDKTYPMGFCAGSRVFVCDNLSFSAELMVRRKHSKYGHQNFLQAIFECVARLEAFQATEMQRIILMQERPLTNYEAESMILQAAISEDQVIPLNKQVAVYDEWRKPQHNEFEPRTAWSLFNAFTHVLGYLRETNTTELARRTLRLNGMFVERLNLALAV